MTTLMQGFPPSPETQVTLANWRTAPHSAWAFHHVRELIATADIRHTPGDVWSLPTALHDFSDLHVADKRGASLPLADVLTQTNTDGMVILHQGQVIFEHYFNGMQAHNPHILMSVSKSMLGLLAGILINKALLDPEALVTDYLPELAATAYKGATVRHLLDMRVGIDFDEDYLATSGPIIEYRKATNWNPLEPGEAPSDLRRFYQTLTQTDGTHWQRFHYVSPNTDLLAWIFERATGTRYTDLMSTHLWQPLGAEESAYMTVDRFGAPRAAGGMCVSVRDLARVGQLVAQGGQREGKRIVSEAWIDDLASAGDREAWNAGSFVAFYPNATMHYRSKWYCLHDYGPLLFGLGVHGQNVFIDRAKQLVIAKVSSQSLPIDASRNSLTMRMVKAIWERF